jgi:hypothetical protein
MRTIVAAILVATLSTTAARADEETAVGTRQYPVQSRQMPLVLIEGRQAAFVADPRIHDATLTLQSYSPRAIEENWFARTEFRGNGGGGE